MRSDQVSTLPPRQRFVYPVLRVMLEGRVFSRREIEHLAAEQMGFSDEARSETLASGITRLTDRTRWAVAYSHRAGFVKRVCRGHYRITKKGLTYLREHSDAFVSSGEVRRHFAPYWEKSGHRTTVAPAQTGICIIVDPADYQSTVPLRIIVDGTQLASLMIKYRVDVQM